MSGIHGTADSLYGPVDSPVHGIAAPVKIVCLVAFLCAVVVTPQRAVPAFLAYGVMVVVAALMSRIPTPVMLRRLLIETPFVLFALALPLIGVGPHHHVAGIAISQPGLWSAWSILAKATLGAAATVLLAWSTPVAEILAALDRLRIPRILTSIAGFMIRYIEVVSFDLRRLQVARVSRGDDPRWIWQARTVGATVGALFVRTFERGERVHNAMMSRGFTGVFPTTTAIRVELRWFPAMMWPVVAWLVAVAASMR